MANPTTNYGFVLPTPTDLVTDLPADFDVALQGVDTRLKALNPSTTLGDVEYASATANTNTRLGIGTSGQVLTVSGGVPTWATPAGGGGITQIATGTLSGTSVTISSISSTYKHLYLRVVGPVVNSGTLFAIRLNADTGNNYVGKRQALDSTVFQIQATTDFFTISGSNMSTGSNNRTYALDIPDYSVTCIKPITGQSRSENATGDQASNFLGQYNSTSVISSITIFPSNGTSTFSAGTYTLFGVN